MPAITTETGQLGQNDERSIALAEHGIRNLMRHLGMLEGTPEANPSVVWLKDYQVIRSPVTGVFRATVRDGYAIAEGGLLGELYDPFGAKIARRARALRGHRQLRGRHAARGRGSAVGDGQPHLCTAATIICARRDCGNVRAAD